MLKQRYNTIINLLEKKCIFHIFKGGLIHYATWESAVYGFSHVSELKHIRKQLFQQKLPYSKYKTERYIITVYTSSLFFFDFRRPVFKTALNGKPTWAIPFPGSDKSVVQRTQYF